MATSAPPLKGTSTRWTEYRDFSYGICQDLPSYAVPDAAVYDATDLLFDQPGRLRKRGGWTTPCVSSSEGVASVGRAVNQNLATGGTIYIYDVVNDLFKAVNTSTGTKSNVGGAGTVPNKPALMGRPAEHLGTVLFPFLKTNAVSPVGSPNVAALIGFAGAFTGTTTSLAHAASASVAAGSSAITIGGGDTTASMAVGQIFSADDGATNFYVGIIEGIIDSTHFNVRPTPTSSFTPVGGSWSDTGIPSSPNGPVFSGGAFVTSFQNRVIVAKTTTFDTTNYVLHPTRIVYSILPDETPATLQAGSQGAYWLNGLGYPDDNFFEVAASSPLSGMTPVGEGQLLFFSPTECFRMTGDLSTQTATTSGISIDVRRVSSNIGALTDRSIAQTQRGVIFGSLDGVYAYDGSQFRPLMDRRVANLWRDYVNNSAALPVGAAIIRGNHYMVSLATANGTIIDTLLCNLDTLAWGRQTNTQIVGSVTDPLDASITWAGRLSTAGWASGVATRPLIRLDPMFSPTSSNRTDGNTTAVTPVLKTRSYVEGDANTRKKFRRVQVEYDMRGGSPTLAVASDTELKVPDASYTTLVTGAGSSTLATTSLSTEVTFDTGAKLSKGVAIQHQITQTGGSDTTEILGIKHGFQSMREGRSN